MKIKFLLYFIFIANMLSAQTNFVEVQKTVSITRTELLEFGYNPPQNLNTPNDKQPFSTKDDIENFLSQILSHKSTELPVQISSWLAQNLTSYNNSSSLIFINHPLSLTQLFSKKYEETAKAYDEACIKNNEKKNIGMLTRPSIKKYLMRLQPIRSN